MTEDVSGLIKELRSHVVDCYGGKNDTMRRAADALASLSLQLAAVEGNSAALAKINDIRNSIIGFQTMNWSEHIYPLVAALEEAGISGQRYPEARANVGTLLERILKAEERAETAEASLSAAQEENERLRKALGKIAAEDDTGPLVYEADEKGRLRLSHNAPGRFAEISRATLSTPSKEGKTDAE